MVRTESVLLAGESTSALAREFGVSKSTISVRFSERSETIKNVAHQIVATEQALSFLNVSEQLAARASGLHLGRVTPQVRAREFGINESSIRRKIKPNKAAQQNSIKPLKILAQEKVRADQEVRRIAEQIAELPITRQQIVSDLARS